MMTCLILFAMSAITLWLVSLWRILSSSSVQDNSSFLSNSKGVGNGRRKSNVLLVVAHPDDESIMLLRENEEINIEAWELISTNIVRKYIGPVDIWISILSSLSGLRGNICCLPNQHPLKSYQAMAAHYSQQWVWFRKLFVLLSRYTYVNTLRRIIY